MKGYSKFSHPLKKRIRHLCQGFAQGTDIGMSENSRLVLGARVLFMLNSESLGVGSIYIAHPPCCSVLNTFKVVNAVLMPMAPGCNGVLQLGPNKHFECGQ